MTTVFIYSKGDKIKALNLEDSKEQHYHLINFGWKHTATLEACAYIEHLYNDKKEIQDLKNI